MDNASRRTSFPDGVPELQDTLTGVRLRPLAEEDLPAVIEQSRDPETIRWTTVPAPYGIAEARGFLEQVQARGWREGTQAGFAIEDEVDGVRRYCGQVDLRFTDPGQAEVGFVLHPAARGRGLMARSVRQVAVWAFSTCGVQVIRWYAAIGNWASRKAAHDAGFIFEGVGRLRVPLRSGLVDGWMGSLTPPDLHRPVVPWLQIPTLDGRTVRLRPLREDDADRLAEAFADPESRQYLVNLPDPYRRSDALSFIEDCRDGAARRRLAAFALADPGTDTCLGALHLNHLDHYARRASVGYVVHPGARGRGVGVEALRLATDHARTAGWSPSMHLLADPRNRASQRVAEKAGWRRVGELRQTEPEPDGSFSDLVMWAHP